MRYCPSPHYIEEICGNPVSLTRRPNPKVPAQNTGEHFQFPEGIGNLMLMMIGCKYININKLAGRIDGTADFAKVPSLLTYTRRLPGGLRMVPLLP